MDRSSQTQERTREWAGEAISQDRQPQPYQQHSVPAPGLLHSTKRSPRQCTSSPRWQHGCRWHQERFFPPGNSHYSLRQLPLDSETSFPVLGTTVSLGRQSTKQLTVLFLWGPFAHLALPTLPKSVPGCCWRSRRSWDTCL